MSRISNNSPEFTDDDSDYIEDSLQEKTTDQFQSDNSDYCIEDSIQDMSSLRIEDESDLDDTTGLPITPIKTKNKKKTAIIDSDSEEEDTNIEKNDKPSPSQCTEKSPKSSEEEHHDLYQRSSNFKVRSTDLDNTSDSPLARTKNKQRIAIIDSDSEDESKTCHKLLNSDTRIQRKSKGLEVDSDSESEGELHDWNPESDHLKGHYSGFDETSESPIAKVENKLKTNIINSDSEEDFKIATKPLASNHKVRHKSFDPEKTSKGLVRSDPYPSEEELHNQYPKSDPDSGHYKPKTVTKGTPVKKETPLEFRKESMLTPRIQRQVSISSNSSVEELRYEENIIDISSDEEAKMPVPVAKKFVGKQITLDKLVQKLKVENNKTPPVDVKEEDPGAVSPETYNKQVTKVGQLESDLRKAKNLLQTLNINALPDKGELLLKRHSYLENILKIEKETLSKMVCRKDMMHCTKKAQIASWEEIEAGASAVQPKTFGKKGIQTYNAQKAMTLDRLEQLHSSLKGRPSDKTEATDPKGLKVSLMPHQKTALAWMMWREQQKPSGGILADDMGLGKTLTMISLMLKTNEQKNEEGDDSEDESNKARKNYKCPGGTLVVCPASLLNQWSGELERRTSRGLASFEVYHGPKRETKPKRLGEYDMVITTYAIILNECEKNGAVFRVRWRRIILDEAHQIRNHKSQTSEAVCKLSGKSRWALTGTPVHNRELDMYALLKFLKCTPFDDLVVWKRWVGDKSTGGQERLHTVISSLLLRRTKAELMKKGALKCLPDRKWELIPVTLEKNEMDVYSKVLMFSRTLFAQYLHQHAEKNQGKVDFDFKTMANGPNSEYFKMRQMLLKYNNVRDVKQHEILVLLLRLRQICCHPCLITGMLQGDEDLGAEEDSENIGEINLLEQLNKLNLDDHDHNPASNIGQEQVGLKEACKGLLNPSNPVFADKTRSSKIRIIMNVIKKNVIANNDKAIVVSQWTSLLRIIALHLEKEGIRFEQLDGSVPVHKRMAIVDNINNPNHKIKILLLSLTAGGVGLNLVGANHLLLLDLHWNPQLESQAQDRIYRVGQNKPVYIYKFMAVGTIEERIKNLQDKKLEIAESMLSGTKQVISSKLTLNDLKMLFEM